MRRAAFLTAAIITVSLVTPITWGSGAWGAGVGASPDAIDISATRDGLETVTLIVFVDVGGVRSLEAEILGLAAGWISMSQEATSATPPIELGENGRATIDLTVTVPSDAPNGFHHATIQMKAADTADSITPSVIVPVTINVTGDAIVAGESEIAVPRVVADSEPLMILGTVTNVGTARAVPRIDYVLSADEVTLARGGVDGAEIGPGQSSEVRVPINHGSNAGATLLLGVTTSVSDVNVATSTYTVDVVEEADISAGIKATGLTVDEPVEPGGVARLTAGFTNTSVLDVSTAFRGSIVKDGADVGSVESITFLAAPGEAADVELFVPVDTEGSYEVTGRWDGQIQSSDDVYLSWTVGSTSSISLVVGAAIIIAGIAVITTIRYRRGTTHATSTTGRKAETSP